MSVAVELRHISKRFPGVIANKDVSMRVETGTVHALVGENGAGKSTVMKILYGMQRPDGGEILVNGNSVHFKNPNDAIEASIGMVHQHFMLVENMSVLDNVMLGAEGGFRLAKNRVEVEAKLREICQRYSLDVDPLALIQDLSVGVQQRVEILKIAEPCPLIDPSQVVVTQGEILVADPVLTPIGGYTLPACFARLLFLLFTCTQWTSFQQKKILYFYRLTVVLSTEI